MKKKGNSIHTHPTHTHAKANEINMSSPEQVVINQEKVSTTYDYTDFNHKDFTAWAKTSSAEKEQEKKIALQNETDESAKKSNTTTYDFTNFNHKDFTAWAKASSERR